MKLSIKATGISVFKKAKNKISEFNQARKAAGGIMPAAAALILCTNNAFADDLLVAGKQTVTDTFGADSSVANWIILAVVIVGIAGYIGTKNMLLLFGVAVVVVFTKVGFLLAA